MANNLTAFLAENAIKVQNIKFVASKRFIDENKKPIEWEIRCLTSKEDEEIRKECTKRVQVPGKRGQYTLDTDYNMYIGKLASRCTVYPNLNSVELQNSYKVMGDDVLLKTMLTAGEYADYMNKVQEVNGFDISFDDKVEEAKN